MISAFAFSPHIIVDGRKEMIIEGDRKMRPVMSRGHVIAPLAFFEKTLGAEVDVDGGKITIRTAENRLTALEGAKAYEADGKTGEYSVPVRRERGILCLPIIETVRALGMSAKQYELLAVIAEEKTLDVLSVNQKMREELVRQTCGVYNAAYFTREDFKKARDAWRYNLCGDETANDPSALWMRNILEMRDRESERMRREMNRSADAVILFGTERPTESLDLSRQYGRILRMALPYGTFGCRGYKSKELLEDILYALDWMHDNMYGANVLSDESFRSYKIFNWHGWYVSGPCPMMDTVMIIAEDIGREMVDKYVLPMSFIRTQMRVNLGPEMGMSRIMSLTPLALLTDDRALLQAVYEDEALILEEHDAGSCMRRDWCCMTHAMPYNIGYGCNNLERAGRILKILDDSPLAFTLPKKYNLMHMVRYTFAPVMYRGRGMNMMGGRGMQSYAVGMKGALRPLREFKNLLGVFGEEEDREICEIIHRNATPWLRDQLISYYDTDRPLDEYVPPIERNVHIPTYAQYRDALNGDKYATAPYQLGYMWYSGDCCVQFRRDYMAALRMNSERLPGYESINQANQDGWYTGDGMLYLYTPDTPEQYDEAWWKGVDKYLMPGTTVEDRLREARSIRYGLWYKSSKDFVGGVDLERQFVTASMDLESFHNDVDLHLVDDGYGVSHEEFDCTLTAMKSWFMFDKAIVALGAEVNAQDNYAVRTVVENKLLTNSVEGILINGQQIPSDFTEETRTDVERIYLPGTGGFIFPMGGKVTMRVYQKEDTPFFACWLEHGDNPRGEKYAYIVLPDASAEETAAYDAGNIEILANDGKIQSAREKASGLTGIVFREACEFAGVEAKQAMIVMMKEENGTISLSACDPTQKKETFEFVVQGAKEIVSCHERMMAEKTENGVKLMVSCDSSRGRGYQATLEI